MEIDHANSSRRCAVSALDDGRRSARKLLRAVVAQLLGLAGLCSETKLGRQPGA
jgi:hypothetical protein